MRRNSIGGVKKHFFGTVKKKHCFFALPDYCAVYYSIALRFTNLTPQARYERVGYY